MWIVPQSNTVFTGVIVLISIFFFFATIRENWGQTNRLPFAVYFLTVALWSGVYLASSLVDGENSAAGLFALNFFLVSCSAKYLAVYSRPQKSSWGNSALFLFLLGMPVLTFLIYLAQPMMGGGDAPLFLRIYENQVEGLWVNAVAAFVILILVSGIARLIKTAITEHAAISTNLFLLLAMLIPVFVTLAMGRDILSVRTLNFDVLFGGEVLSLLLMGYAAIAQLPREGSIRAPIIENMPDGWMLINEENRIIDLNAEAAGILGVSKDEALNAPFESFRLDLPLNQNGYDNPVNVDIRKSFKKRDEFKYYNIQITFIRSEPDKLWKLLLWRDTTNQKLLENSRQSARDEMFVLLNAVSSEASHSASLSEFLDGAIYQLIFSFRTQAAVIYLPSNMDNGVSLDPKTFKPFSVFGISPEKFRLIQEHDEEFRLFEMDGILQEPYLITDPESEPRLPAPLRNGTFDSVLFLHFVTRQAGERHNIGGMFLARKEKPVYSTSEVLKLGALADHIANLVHDERRRKLAIAFSERQRLMRDLHDSVSQKLYGLVALTEAAQALIESGRDLDPKKMMSRIGENARQAVREMRLFLHQMQVVEIEKEGLISALHHRLAAVEGRADIKAGLLADETIKLPPDVEIALYYIAQEALNNVLRHAKASQVDVSFKQSPKNIILKIKDNGKGFDLRNVDQTGLGLASMKERTEKINGKLKIISRVDGGTVVTITIPKIYGKS